MLRITSRAAGDECVLKLEGRLAGAWVPELEASWRTVAARTPASHVRLDLTDVCHVDAAGRELLTLMYRAGVRFVASGFVIPELVREIADAVDGKARSSPCLF
jgi:anti-anti-sigma regulatory factor